MRIIGVGTDIVAVERIARLTRYPQHRFARRLLHEQEYERFLQLALSQQAHWLAKRFASKEACAKALGTGIGQHVRLTEIETDHDERGCPHLVLHGITQQTAHALGVQSYSLSVSDEQAYAIAFVVLTG